MVYYLSFMPNISRLFTKTALEFVQGMNEKLHPIVFMKVNRYMYTYDKLLSGFANLCQQKEPQWPHLLTWFNFNSSMDK